MKASDVAMVTGITASNLLGPFIGIGVYKATKGIASKQFGKEADEYLEKNRKR